MTSFTNAALATSLARAVTRPALTLAYARHVHVGANKSVTVDTFHSLRFRQLPRPQQLRTDPASTILRASHWLQVVWIAARAVSTKMVKFQSVWDRTDDPFVDHSMSGGA